MLDSTFSSPSHARDLVNQALGADRRVSILYVRRPMEDALLGMLERAERQGRVVSIDQMIGSDRGAAETVLGLWHEFREDPRFQFRFVDNRGDAPRLGTVELAEPRDYAGVRESQSEAAETQANRTAADREAQAAVEGLRRLAQRKRKSRPKAA